MTSLRMSPSSLAKKRESGKDKALQSQVCRAQVCWSPFKGGVTNAEVTAVVWLNWEDTKHSLNIYAHPKGKHYF